MALRLFPLQALTVLEYLLKNGSDQCVHLTQAEIAFKLEDLAVFEYVTAEGQDQGKNVQLRYTALQCSRSANSWQPNCCSQSRRCTGKAISFLTESLGMYCGLYADRHTPAQANYLVASGCYACLEGGPVSAWVCAANAADEALQDASTSVLHKGCRGTGAWG